MSSATRDAFFDRKERRAIHRRLPLVVGAISRRASAREHYRLRGSPGIVRLQASVWSAGPLTGSSLAPPRGKVTIFSQKSRKRLRIAANEIAWPARQLVFVTLTYPRHFSADPRSWKRDLDAWRRAVARTYGAPLAVWALEFQRRGAPHFHIALVLPEAFRLSRREQEAVAAGLASARPGGPSVEEFRAWAAQTWYRIAGHGDLRHLEQHRKPGHCKAAHGPRGLVGYLQQELGKKTEQKALPTWLTEAEGVGRWWGIWGNLRRVFTDERITPAEFTRLRRLMRTQLRRRGARQQDWSWRWSHVYLFDQSKHDWSLYRELLQFLAIVRGRPGPRGSLASLAVRGSAQLTFPAFALPPPAPVL